MLQKALFLDRDGVINKDLGHVYKIEDFVFMNGIFDLANYAINLDYLIIVITNQAGIAKGLYSIEDFFKLNKWMIQQFESRKIRIAKVFFSPFHPEGIIKEYKGNHISRKPNPGMIFDAQTYFNLDLSESILIGDKDSDINAGISASVGTNIFLVNENYDYHKLEDGSYYRINSLAEAKNFMRSQSA